MRHKSLLMVLALAATVATAAAATDVYKWTDATGVVHYSDTEPAAELKAQLLHLSGTSAKQVAATPPADAGSAADDGTQGAQPEGNTQTATAPSAGKRCEQARADLELLQSQTPVGIDKNGDGKPEALDAQARQAQIARAQLIIAQACR
jgi:opacity protein-like surface antigen